MNAVNTQRPADPHDVDPLVCLECPDCHGRGALAAPRRGLFGTLHRWLLGRPWMDAHALPCPTCRGDGCVERRPAS